MDINSVDREHIEKERNEIDPQPDPGWERMEQAAQQARQNAPAVPSGNQQNPHQDVPQDEQLDHVVGTESNSY